MNRNYISGFILTALSVCLSLSVSASIISTDTTIPLGTVLSNQTFNTGDPDEFTVNCNEISITNRMFSGTSCGVSPMMSVWSFDETSSNINNSSYVDINLTGEEGEFAELYLRGITAGTWGSTAVIGFSTGDGVYSNGVDLELPLGVMQCYYVNIIPPAGTKNIRIARVLGTWAGIYTGDSSLENGLFQLKDIIVTTQFDDETTSVELTKATSLKVDFNGEEITVSEAVQIEVYNISGKLVLQSSGTNAVSTEGLSKGIYIIKAESVSGKTLVTKIVK